MSIAQTHSHKKIYRILNFVDKYIERNQMTPEYEYVSKKLSIPINAVYRIMNENGYTPDGPEPIDEILN